MNQDELFQWLLTNQEARTYCGICQNPDGTYWIGDLELIKMQPEETKVMLRAFLKQYGKRPEPKQEPTDTEPKPQPGAKPSETVRSALDALYAKIDALRGGVPIGKGYLR